MNVSLPRAWEEFVAAQVASGEFGNASEVVREALRLLREQQERRALAEMRSAFASVDAHGRQGEPTAENRVVIEDTIRRYRSGKHGE